MELQEREKNILAGLSVVLVVLVYLYIFQPSGEKYHNLQKEVKQLQSQLRDPQYKKEDLEKAEAQVALLKKEIKTLNYQLPLTEKRGFLIRDLESLAKENKIELISFLPKEAVPVTMTGKEIDTRRSSSRYRKKSQELEEQHAKVLKTIINIDSKGKFADYSKFFSDIITYYRAVEISDLIIARGAAAAKMGQDKRFSKKRSGDDPLEEATNSELAVSFTLLAYTSLPNNETKN